MCRFMIYKGSDPILLSKLIVEPTHSVLHQSYHPRLLMSVGQRHTGDGFGIGYYTDRSLGPEPCIFTSIIPAWNCANLPRLAAKTTSSLLFAHMRATTEGALSDQNCHPFAHGSIMWMHNGGLAGFQSYKRRLGASLADKWYLSVQGGTDSEWAFALFLDSLEQLGHDPSAAPVQGFGPTALRKAMLRTIARINEFTRAMAQKRGAKTGASLLNFAVTDGVSVICTRYVGSKTDEAASLYYSSGTTWEDKSKKGEYQMDRRDKGADIVLVASEPLTFERENWVTVPTNSVLTIHKQTVMVHPIIDENYNPSLEQQRSQKLVSDQGLLAPTPAISDANNPHKQLGSGSHQAKSSSEVSDAMRRLAMNAPPSRFKLQDLTSAKRVKP